MWALFLVTIGTLQAQEQPGAAALEVLAGSGLVPPLRLVPRSQAS